MAPATRLDHRTVGSIGGQVVRRKYRYRYSSKQYCCSHHLGARSHRSEMHCDRTRSCGTGVAEFLNLFSTSLFHGRTRRVLFSIHLCSPDTSFNTGLHHHGLESLRRRHTCHDTIVCSTCPMTQANVVRRHRYSRQRALEEPLRDSTMAGDREASSTRLGMPLSLRFLGPPVPVE